MQACIFADLPRVPGGKLIPPLAHPPLYEYMLRNGGLAH